ncbi:MAG: hypothetical protein CME05_07805 [Gemmatimonadaceae bacterium]|nr:hypothetical protein [Gemmatimonadaceae bacterium]
MLQHATVRVAQFPGRGSYRVHCVEVSRRVLRRRDVLFLDGIPRSRAQAEVLADKVDMLLLLHLRADQEPILERIHKRALQENRLDDANPDVVRRRFQESEAETAPILDFCPAAKIRTVDASAAPLEVLRQIIEILQIMLFPEALQHAA